MYEAIRQWKEHLLFCKKYVWIVAKPFRFREKADVFVAFLVNRHIEILSVTPSFD